MAAAKGVRKLSSQGFYLYYTYFLLDSSGDAGDGFPSSQFPSALQYRL